MINAELRMVVPRSEDARLVMFSCNAPNRSGSGMLWARLPIQPPKGVGDRIDARARGDAEYEEDDEGGDGGRSAGVTIDRSVIRGHADLVHVRQTDSAEFSMSHCVVALGGSFCTRLVPGAPPPSNVVLSSSTSFTSVLCWERT
ncbi:MAG: hypothetical protein Ct9H300mP1_21810 [Planctomycetaceae bacterium]|nr:MAG: hypothetical protein Ct9H300mP1_21810 [Planctomycetaceae bacterium]